MKTDIEIAQEAKMLHIRLRQERERPRSVSDLVRHLDSLGKKQ